VSLAVALALMAAHSAQAPAANLAGLYTTNQMEMAGALELKRDGHFRYQFDYGAVSEEAEGNWTLDGKTVRLTSSPMPKLPDFALVRDDPAPVGELHVAVEDSQFGTWTPLDVIVTVDGGSAPFGLYAEDDGRVIIPGGRRATSVKMLLPANETGGDPVQLSADRGHSLLFRIEPNDMGKAVFRGEPLTLAGSAMVMHHYDTEIIFRRVKR
jgi:hypothetical protein